MFCYLLVGGDGNGEHFDSMLLGFVGRLLHAAARLFVPGDGMSVGHHHDVLVLVVVGAAERTGTHMFGPMTLHCMSQCVCVFVCVRARRLPNEQLGEASLDGAVGVGALADVVDAVDVVLQGGAVGGQVAQLSDQDDFVTVVQRSRVPRQRAVASVAAACKKDSWVTCTSGTSGVMREYMFIKDTFNLRNVTCVFLKSITCLISYRKKGQSLTL